ncbi:mitochondrial nucleoid-associated protein 1 [Opisthocomus hoazin]|uniref:mitochondrial nucleoid-associated protein 1 n=1 Tax=Opisthocomus hoazin TaxID=30419 RepID=UPI003F533274
MAAAPPGRELCPYCRRPFKRLRSHLPHCKAAPSPVPGSAPGLGLSPTPGSAPRLGLSPAAGPSAPRSGSGPVGAGPAAGPRTGAAGKSSKRLPGSGVGQGLPGAAPWEAAAGKGKGAAAGAEQGGGPGPGLGRQPDGRRAERKVEPAVQDAAKSLDLLPEEVKNIPEKLNNGVKIVIEKHRARVVREESGSRGRHASAGPSSADRAPVEGLGLGGAAAHADAARPDPREGTALPETACTETHGLRAAERASASSKGGKGSSLKATKTRGLGDPPEAGCRSSPGDLGQQEGIGRAVTEESQMYAEVGVERKAPLSALHTKNLHLSVVEGFKGHSEGTSRNYLTSIQKLRESEKQMAAVAEPTLQARRDAELAPDQFLLRTAKSQPICRCGAAGRSTPAGATGLEWFPDLYPNYHGLSIFPGNPSREDVGIATKAPKGNFSERQQGPRSEGRLMDVRLGELPAWFAACDFSPQGLLGGVQRAWSSYYDKYINVKRGGPAGISMLLAGYCLLSYGWNYQHIKCHRWRKYH